MTTTTTFALIRHGQTDWNAAARIQGATDIPLNDVGRGQATDAVAPLSRYDWDFIVSSPLCRAAETADLIGKQLRLDSARRIAGLIERNYGPAEGLSAGAELDALRFPGGFRGAETEAAVAARGIDALRQLAREHPGARIIVVAHGTLIRLSLAHALDQRIGSISNATLNLVHHHLAHADGMTTWQLEMLNGESLVRV
ncbi:MAG: histidine phosphatase family protein [Cryobacterium sp.]|uniref:histidine phosphatase family protein n=1 Tax=unclassified Cryobacterium TaxID=2649013 RepID=UPI0018C8FD16|nr:MULTISPECIES: histidine phosphatase family protein [unclassified Cryobacterium]MCY7404612.1 histidine phosphatase family protein [Cryobacterium sp.]MEC5153814.1 putative phosphatase [Cryobacterium sp. CAN_C3]